jgi:hypothetical protein
MDLIIEKFGNLATNDSIYEDELGMEQLLESIKTLEYSHSDFECEKLVTNYSKLSVLKFLVMDSDILVKPFTKFMEKIDTINQYYLQNINLDPDYYDSDIDLDLRISCNSSSVVTLSVYDIQSLKGSVSVIKSSLEESLNCNDPSEKLDYVLIAYGTMIHIVEVINKKSYQDKSVNEDFIRGFKKRKY